MRKAIDWKTKQKQKYKINGKGKAGDELALSTSQSWRLNAIGKRSPSEKSRCRITSFSQSTLATSCVVHDPLSLPLNSTSCIIWWRELDISSPSPCTQFPLETSLSWTVCCVIKWHVIDKRSRPDLISLRAGQLLMNRNRTRVVSKIDIIHCIQIALKSFHCHVLFLTA